MLKFSLIDYGVEPGYCSLQKINEIFQTISNFSGEKQLVIEKGEYIFSASEAGNYNLHMSNTISQDEITRNDLSENRSIALFLKNINKLEIIGNNSTFVFDGQVTYMAMIECIDIVINDLCFTNLNPDCHTIDIIDKKLRTFDFQIDSYSQCSKIEENFFWTGNNFKTPILDKQNKKNWISFTSKNSPYISRSSHPLKRVRQLLEIQGANRQYKAKSFLSKVKNGDRFALFSNLRNCVGIFLDSCNNIYFNRFKQSFNYSIGVLAQNSENLYFKDIEFTPKDELFLTSIADFMHFSMCRGKISILDSKFIGSSDDVLNVHGIYFKIIKRKGNRIIVKFIHPQTYGFNPFRDNDVIAFISAKTLYNHGETQVVSSSMLDLYTIDLQIKKMIEEGDYIQSVSSNPSLDFVNNVIDAVATRGLLVTTSGKVTISKNSFRNISMSAVLISGDAQNWFESGAVKDICITENEFHNIKGYCIEINPTCKPKNTVVHSGIFIENNYFNTTHKEILIYIALSKDVVINNNYFFSEKLTSQKVKSLSSENVVIISD